jgi:hypothetical protein
VHDARAAHIQAIGLRHLRAPLVYVAAAPEEDSTDNARQRGVDAVAPDQ